MIQITRPNLKFQFIFSLHISDLLKANLKSNPKSFNNKTITVHIFSSKVDWYINEYTAFKIKHLKQLFIGGCHC